MKKSVTFCFVMLIASVMVAQSPQAFKYQAVARDLNGDPVINQDIAVKISILSGSESGPLVYSELHEISTNQMGLFTLEIGNATFVFSGNFSEIGWGAFPHFLKTEIDINGGSDYQLMGVSQLVSVPYALYANEAGNVQNYTGGNGINVSNGVISNTAPDQNVTIAPGNGISTSGTYPNFMVTNTNPDQNVTLSSGYGITTSGTYPNFIITNTQPNIAHTGDATGSSALTVEKIQGRSISTTVPSNGQALKWNGTTSKWEPSTDNNTTYTAGTGLSLTGTVFANISPNATHTGDVIGSNALTVVKLQGKDVATTAPSIGQVLKWNNSTSKWEPTNEDNTTSVIKDSDNDTKVQVEETADEDMIRFDLVGTERWVMTGARLEPKNTGYSVFIGDSTGYADDLFSNYNTFIGTRAGRSNTNGYSNTAVGSLALYANTTGDNNTATGIYALFYNTTGFFNTASGKGAMYFNTTGNNNTAFGKDAMHSNTTGNNNTGIGRYSLGNNKGNHRSTAIGYYAMGNADNRTLGIETFNTALGYEALKGSTNLANNTGRYNTAVGDNALFSISVGNDNTAAGYSALYSNTSGVQNTSVGSKSLHSNTSGYANTATGFQSLYSNTSGDYNTANGMNALYSNISGNNNTAIGNEALADNSTGYSNTASGNMALNKNTEGYYNTAIGHYALPDNITGNSNTASGVFALRTNATGDNNTANGFEALKNNLSGSSNTAMGMSALSVNTSGSNNTSLGYSAGNSGATHNQCTFIGASTSLLTTRSNVTLLGYGIGNAQCTSDNQVLLGNTAVTQIRAAVAGITAYSDERYKTNVKENVAGLGFILKLKPVTYNVNPNELHKIWGTPDSLVDKMDFSDAKKEVRIGFVAQDVEKAAKESGFDFPGIDVPRNDKEVYSLRYVDFIMPLVKAVQEQQKIIAEMQKEIEELKNKLEKTK